MVAGGWCSNPPDEPVGKMIVPHRSTTMISKNKKESPPGLPQGGGFQALEEVERHQAGGWEGHGHWYGVTPLGQRKGQGDEHARTKSQVNNGRWRPPAARWSTGVCGSIKTCDETSKKEHGGRGTMAPEGRTHVTPGASAPGGGHKKVMSHRGPRNREGPAPI